VQTRVQERLVHRLGQAKVDHLRHRPVVVPADQQVGRLQVAVNDPLLVGVLHRLANRDEQVEALGNRQSGLVAVLRDWHALDIFHDEEGPTLPGRAAVEHSGDVGMVHQGQGLPLRLEPGQDHPRVQACLDQLDGHLPAHRLGLLGQPHRAHASLADPLEQLVAAGQHMPGGFGGRIHARRPVVGQGRPDPFQKTAGLFLPRQQGLQALADRRRAAASPVEEGGSVVRLLIQGGFKQFTLGHGARPPSSMRKPGAFCANNSVPYGRLSSSRSQARA
jgi:hypothetical protein